MNLKIARVNQLTFVSKTLREKCPSDLLHLRNQSEYRKIMIRNSSVFGNIPHSESLKKLSPKLLDLLPYYLNINLI